MTIEAKTYFVLISILTPNKEHAQLLPQLTAVCSEPAKIIWQQNSNIAFGAVSTLTATKLHNHIIHGFTGINNIFILEVTRDWSALSDTTLAGWLKSHVGAPKAF